MERPRCAHCYDTGINRYAIGREFCPCAGGQIVKEREEEAKKEKTGPCCVCGEPGDLVDMRSQRFYGATFPIILCKTHRLNPIAPLPPEFIGKPNAVEKIFGKEIADNIRACFE